MRTNLCGARGLFDLDGNRNDDDAPNTSIWSVMHARRASAARGGSSTLMGIGTSIELWMSK
eukprot:363695-Pleurochrysis_carterae.AAC.1